MTRERIRVVIADDDELFVRGLRTLLDADDRVEVVGTATSGEAAVEIAAAAAADVVLMDVLLPGLDGIEATSRLLALRPGTRVVVISAYAYWQLERQAYDAGATNFLSKDQAADDISQAVIAAACPPAEGGPHAP